MKTKVVTNQASTTETSAYPYSGHVPEKKRLEMVELYLRNIAEKSLSISSVVKHLMGEEAWGDALLNDSEDRMYEFLEPMDENDGVGEFFQKALPMLIENDLGAKKVSIEWG